jgi:hypothetical protein
VWVLDRQLRAIWNTKAPSGVIAVAVDGLGARVAAADNKGGVQVHGQAGSLLWRAVSQRPLSFLTFVPEEPALVGCADHGLVTAFDAAGACSWRDGLVANVGSLATSGDGATLACACFTEGVIGYSLNGPARRSLFATPCKFAALSYDGTAWLTVELDDRLSLRDETGTVKAERKLERPAVSIAMDALGTSAAVALTDGTVLRLGW